MSQTTPDPLSPWVVVDGAAGFLDFATEVFGAVELGRMPGPEGRVGHAETRLGAVALVVMDVRAGWPPAPVRLRLHVEDLPDVVARAVAAGSRAHVEPVRLPTGEAVAILTDPWGGVWWLHEQVEQPDVTELIARLGTPEARELMTGFEAGMDAALRGRGRIEPDPGRSSAAPTQASTEARNATCAATDFSNTSPT